MGGYNDPFHIGSRMLLTEGVQINSNYAGYDVTSLIVKIAPTCKGITNPGKADIKLGLYQEQSSSPQGGTSTLVLLATTNNIHVTASQAKHGHVFTAAVQFPAFHVLTGGAYYVGIASNNGKLCLDTNTNVQITDPSSENNYKYAVNANNPNGKNLPSSFTSTAMTTNPDFKAGLTLCPANNVVGDPVFRGFHGQQFTVKGEAGRVFNVLSSATMSFNSRFIALAESESMTASDMKAVRASFGQSKMLDLLQGSDAVNRPPVTTAWSHNGTYMGECGLKMGELELYVAPGAYATGFSAVTIDGVSVPISSRPVELDGDMTVTHPSAFKLIVATPDMRFTIVNADRFVNIEHASVLNADAQLSGLLGQTADAEWEVVQSAEWKEHLETDFKLGSDDLFGADFPGQQF